MDAPAELAALHRRWLMSRSGAERLRMATAMFGLAKTLAVARVKALGVTDGVALDAGVVRQLYGSDLDPAILEHLLERRALTAGLEPPGS